jgi:hypothetical protein
VTQAHQFAWFEVPQSMEQKEAGVLIKGSVFRRLLNRCLRVCVVGFKSLIYIKRKRFFWLGVREKISIRDCPGLTRTIQDDPV